MASTSNCIASFIRGTVARRFIVPLNAVKYAHYIVANVYTDAWKDPQSQ